MRSRIVLINFLAAIFVLGGLGLSIGEAEASPDIVTENVHGISYSSASSLKLSITEKDGQSFSFPIIDWYIYGTGTVSYDDGTVSETFAVDGLTVFHAEYSPGSTVAVSIGLNDEIYTFDLTIRSNSSLIFEEDQNLIEIGEAELSSRDVRNITVGAAVIFLGFLVGLFFAKRSANRGDRSI